MLMFDDRFARQNHYGLPPEFLLASTYTSIVHHLSGPNIYALAPPRGKNHQDGPVVQLVRQCGPASYLSLPNGKPLLSFRLRVS